MRFARLSASEVEGLRYTSGLLDRCKRDSAVHHKILNTNVATTYLTHLANSCNVTFLRFTGLTFLRSTFSED